MNKKKNNKKKKNKYNQSIGFLRFNAILIFYFVVYNFL